MKHTSLVLFFLFLLWNDAYSQEKINLFYYVAVKDSVKNDFIMISSIEKMEFIGAPAFETYQKFGKEIYPQFAKFIQKNKYKSLLSKLVPVDYYLSASKKEIRKKISEIKKNRRQNDYKIIRIRKFRITL
jgi:hypothetical protein